MSDPITLLSISELTENLSSGSLSSVAITESFLESISKENKSLKAYIHVSVNSALQQALESDQRRKEGNPLSNIDGIPIAIKDNINIRDTITTAGIEAYRNNLVKKDAEVIRKLRASGAIFLGKLNMDEGAHGATTANKTYGFCNNPHRIGFTPGGSSGGAGSALASGLCAGALGTDTLGSVRIPASFCGVVGFKPTFGLISTNGVMPLCYKLDHVGPMAKTVNDVALLFESICGFDINDPYSRYKKSPKAKKSNQINISKIKLGYLEDIDSFVRDDIDDKVKNAYINSINLLKEKKFTISPIDWGNYQHEKLRSKAMLLIESDLANVHSQMLEKYPEGFTNKFLDGIEFAKKSLAPKLADSILMIDKTRTIAHQIFSKIDFVITPTTPIAAFPFDKDMPKSIATFTSFANYTGCPAISIPAPHGSELPVGLQITGPKYSDYSLLNLAHLFEEKIRDNKTT